MFYDQPSIYNSLAGDAMRREIVFPSLHGHQAPQTKTFWLGSVVKSSWPDRRPPKLLLHICTISGASRMFELSQTLLKSRSKIARNSSPLYAENSARKASKRWSHFHEKTPQEALNNFLETFSMSDFLRCMIGFFVKKYLYVCQFLFMPGRIFFRKYPARHFLVFSF